MRRIGGAYVEPTLIFTIVVGVSGVVIGWLGRARDSRKDAEQGAGTSARLSSDIAYIVRGVDDIRVDVRAQGRRLDELSERVTRVEESAKQSHKRLDRLEGTER